MVVYTTTTGQEPVITDEALREFVYPTPEADPHCFVCNRHTDHAGEHDDLVELGLASYDGEGNVYSKVNTPWRFQ